MQYGQYPAPRFTVAHLSDVHLLAHGVKQYGVVQPENGLRLALERLGRLDPVPQALVFTGDLADLGEREAYRTLRGLVEPYAAEAGAQVVWCMGNHDDRATYSRELFGAESEASQDRVRDAAGLCLANYSLDGEELRFAISDDCAASQLGTILPEVGAYAAGLLEFLFRGTLAVAIDGGAAQVTVPRNEVQLGAGKVTIAVEDTGGKRSLAGSADLVNGAARVALPADATRIYAVFRGVDAAGEPVVATGSSTK